MEQVSKKNVRQNLASELFISLVNSPKQPMHARISVKNKMLWKRIFEKPKKKFTLFFLLKPVPFYEQDYEKQEMPETTY